jgi:hypothetical protein
MDGEQADDTLGSALPPAEDGDLIEARLRRGVPVRDARGRDPLLSSAFADAVGGYPAGAVRFAAGCPPAAEALGRARRRRRAPRLPRVRIPFPRLADATGRQIAAASEETPPKVRGVSSLFRHFSRIP